MTKSKSILITKKRFEALNDRRINLIQKKYRDCDLSTLEKQELEVLQEITDMYLDEKYPISELLIKVKRAIKNAQEK